MATVVSRWDCWSMGFPSLTAVNGFFGYNLVFAGLRCLLRFGQNDHDILNIQEHNIFGVGNCRQQNLNITKSKTNLQLANACQGNWKTEVKIFSWLILQENGTLLLIFDAIGFELNLDNPKQSTFIAPDSTMFNLVPGAPAIIGLFKCCYDEEKML